MEPGLFYNLFMMYSPKLFIHGSDSNSQTYKATLLRKIFPEIIVPDFVGSLDIRMEQLISIIGKSSGWILIGSSLGGLMATLFTVKHSEQVQKLVLLAPALNLPVFSGELLAPISIPTVIIHGTQDDIVPNTQIRELSEKIFTNLTFYEVFDDHRLHKTAETLDWHMILA